MSKILLTLMIPFLLVAGSFQYNLVLTSTYVEIIDAPTSDSYIVDHEGLHNDAVLDLYGYYGPFNFSARMSNRLPSSPLEGASLEYKYRKRNHILSTEVGILDSYRGTMSTSKSSVQQPPNIFKNSGVYNDEFMSGFLESTVGIRQKYSYIFMNDFVITGSYLYAYLRVLDETKAEQAMFGYESLHAEFGFNDPIHSRELTIDWRNNLTLFLQDFCFDFHIAPTHSMSPAKAYETYLKTGDQSIYASSPKPYSVDSWRVGGMYTDNIFTLGYEYFEMEVENKAVNYGVDIHGYLYYLAVDVKDFTPYVSYGSSGNDRDKDLNYEEYIVGLRYILNDSFAIIGEYKRSNWIQHDTLRQHKAFVNSGSREIEAVMLQTILSF